MTPQHHIIKETSDTLSRLLQDEFKRSGYKRVHVLEEAPKADAIEGKLPAVSVYMFQISPDFTGVVGNLTREMVKVQQEDGSEKEFSRERRRFIKLEYFISTWAQTPEDEQLLLGLVIRTVMENRVVPHDRLRGESFEDDYKMFIALAPKLDEHTLSRFWSNIQQPMRPALHVFTVVPIIPQVVTPLTRVEKRQLVYRDLNNPQTTESGPDRMPFTRRDLNLGRKN